MSVWLEVNHGIVMTLRSLLFEVLTVISGERKFLNEIPFDEIQVYIGLEL